MAKDMDVEKFIEAVRLRGPLWNKTDPMHRNLEITTSLWNEVIAEMGGNLTVAELKQKWHNLRDCFRREIRTAEAGKKKRKWIYYNQMLFSLTPELKDQKYAESNRRRSVEQDSCPALLPIKFEPPSDICQIDLQETHSNNSDFIETENIDHEFKVDRNCLSRDSQTDIENGELSESPALGEAGECKRETDNLNSLNSRARDRRRHQTYSTDNDDYHFAMSIIPHMREVPAHRKLRMRIRISEIIVQESGYDETPS